MLLALCVRRGEMSDAGQQRYVLGGAGTSRIAEVVAHFCDSGASIIAHLDMR